MSNIPRAEHPNPQWERKEWLNLNGVWEFGFDFGNSAGDKKLYESDGPLEKSILVPFCPESRLSGIAYTDFINGVCYKRTFELSEDEASKRVVLNFGAVDYEAFIYINKKLVGSHKGGYSSFAFDISDYINIGENTVFVIVKDDVRSGLQPRGKQAVLYYSSVCDYTRTTGIWQTVWLEFTPKEYIKSVKYYPDVNNKSVTVVGEVCGKGVVSVKTSFEGTNTGSADAECSGFFTLTVALSESHIWELGVGNIYDIELTFGDDSVKSYFGLRSIALENGKFMLNGKSVFQRLVLDQGFYQDGVYTAPSDDDLKKDIELSMNAGFNGARLHEKVFEPRFLYHCDKTGYMVWGEYANWGVDYKLPEATEIFINEWMEVVARDFNHPSIIGWCPFNETWGYIESRERNRLLSTIYKYTKQFDVTRPVIDTSGNYHIITDIYDVHDYEQNPEVFKLHYDELFKSGKLFEGVNHENDITQTHNGEPVMMSEYGGIQWNTDGNAGWGYGEACKTPDEFLQRYKGLTDALLDNPSMIGFCYTQLYDIEQEINGLYKYNREPKFDISFFKKVNERKAAIE